MHGSNQRLSKDKDGADNQGRGDFQRWRGTSLRDLIDCKMDKLPSPRQGKGKAPVFYHLQFVDAGSRILLNLILRNEYILYALNICQSATR